MNLSAIRDRVAVDTVRLAPKRLYSGAVGWGARKRLPRPLRVPVYTAFARWVGARLDEIELPLAEYPSFGSFFARRLREGARTVATSSDALICPCDGRIAAVGVATEGLLIQAKGKRYDLATLLVDQALAARLEGGRYLTVYLSPRDYHRVHAPADVEVVGYDYVPGALYPVNPFFSRHIDNLLAANERMVLHLSSAGGAIAMVLVGAAGVGNVTLCHPRVQARELRSARTRRRVRFREPVAVARGDELAAFNLGSTVVLVFEPGRADLSGIELGTAMQFGQAIGTTSPIGRN